MALKAEPAAGPMAILAVGFGMSVAMWAVGYVGRLPAVGLPAAALLGVILACLVAGGVLLGRRAGVGFGGGAAAGAITATLNLLVLGSVLTGGAAEGDTTALVPSALVWLPGSYLTCAALAGLAALLARRRAAAPDGWAWRSGFVLVAATATLLVLIAGGLVTSLEAGLAVPDWPNSFGSNMFLYPLSRMTGGIYYEHAHRLYGSLVGVTTIVLAGLLWRTDDRRWVRWLGVLAVLFVVTQGVLGGLRVTGGFTLSQDAAVIAPNRALAVVHGVSGQIFFALVVLLWVLTTRTWRDRMSTEVAGFDRRLSLGLALLLVGQLVLGALYRHDTSGDALPAAAAAHITLAALVALAAYLAGLRAWARYTAVPAIHRAGIAIMLIVSFQLLLGLGALIAVLAGRDAPTPPAAEVLLATAHQANGALLLASAVMLAAWMRRGAESRGSSGVGLGAR